MIEYTQTELRVMAVCSAVGAVFSFLVGGVDAPMVYFLLLMAVDYFSGIIAAWKTGTLSSIRAFKGIGKKISVLAFICLANIIDGASGGGNVFKTAAMLGYVGMEGLSILENIDRCGWGKHIPPFLRDKLAQLNTEKGGRC